MKLSILMNTTEQLDQTHCARKLVRHVHGWKTRILFKSFHKKVLRDELNFCKKQDCISESAFS